MNNIVLGILIFLFALNASLQAQIEGDNIFENDQIIKIELDFDQVSFYDSLVLNYATTTYMQADLTLTDETGSYTFSDVGVRLKGNSSYGHPGTKKSFKIDFNKYVSGQNYDGLKKLNFSNGFKDPSCMREKIFFDVCREAGVPAPRANFANVYFNGELWGFYAVIEQIDDQFLDWRILDDDGNLFKAGANFGGGQGGGGNAADLVYYGADQSLYEERYDLKSNEDENDWSDLIAFTDFINNSSPADFESQFEDRIESQEYLRSAALDNLFSNLDSYTGSARNYYIYHNLTTDKWEWIKWDANESFGTYRAGGGGPGGGGGTNVLTLAVDHHDASRPLLENVFNSPVLFNKYLAEMCFLTENYFNPEYLNPEIDKIKALIQESVYADNNKMYSNNNFDQNSETDISVGGGPGGGSVYGLKSFVAERLDFIKSQMECLDTSTKSTSIENWEVYPNPFQNLLTINLEDVSASSIIIYNSIGQQVYAKAIIGYEEIELDLSSLAPGIYFAGLFDDDNTSTSAMLKLVKN